MYIKPANIRAALQSVMNNGTQFLLCPSDPSTLSDAQASYLCNNTTAFSFSIATENDSQVLKCSSFNATARASGVANILVLVGSDIEAKIYIEPIPVEAGEVISIDAFDLWAINNPSF